MYDYHDRICNLSNIDGFWNAQDNMLSQKYAGEATHKKALILFFFDYI